MDGLFHGKSPQQMIINSPVAADVGDVGDVRVRDVEDVRDVRVRDVEDVEDVRDVRVRDVEGRGGRGGRGKGLLRNDNWETVIVNMSLCMGGPHFDPAASS